MPKPKIPIRLILRLIPAIIAGIVELVEAMGEDSPGGKKITRDEAEEVVQAIIDKIRPVVMAELVERD